MRNLVTLSDSKYDKQGLLLYNSLMKVNPDFRLHYLCLDDDTYALFSALPNVWAYTYDEIDSPELQAHKDSHTWEQHCWCLASYFMDWLMDKEDVELLYIDADIMFYSDYELIYEEVGEKSIGIITHRFPENKKHKSGYYNVGVIYFRNDAPGRACLNWWRDVVLTDGGTDFKDYSTCGDQKYLELFIPMFDGQVQVIDEKVGHAAPWNAYRQSCDGKWISWKGRKQPLVFFHFSHFNLTETGYRTNHHEEWTPEVDADWAKELYDQYYGLIKQLM